MKLNSVFLIAMILVACGKNPVTWVTVSTVTDTDISINTNASEYLGCYQDNTVRALPNKLMSSGATVEICVALAKFSGYSYAGVQWGIECWAGNTVNYNKLPDSSCNMTCNANVSEICGGSGINSVYSTGL